MKKFILSLCVMFAAVPLLAGSAPAAISGEDFLALCESGTPKKIERAIGDGADVNAANEGGVTPLMLVAEERKDADVLLMLIEAGADVNAANNDGDTALHYAAYWNGNTKVVETLIEHGADLNRKGEYERTPLMHAVAGGEAGNIIVLLEAGADANIEDEDGKKAIDHMPGSPPSDDEWEAATERLRSGGGSGGGSEPPAASAPDAEVTGLWLEIPGFPQNAEADLKIDEGGEDDEGSEVVYIRQLDGGDLRLTILRLRNIDNAVTPENVARLIAGVAGIDEDDADVSGYEEPDAESDILPFTQYPHATAEYETEEDGEEIQNVECLFFPEGGFLFWVRVAINETARAKYGSDLMEWFEGMKMVER